MDAVTTWIDCAKERPPQPTKESKRLFWFRVVGRTLPGTACTVEWADELTRCGMGCAPSEYWPPFSHWDGWQRTLPKGAQWRPAEDGVAPRALRLPGLEIAGCPFCGTAPKLEWSHRALGGGVHVGSAPYLANSFSLACPHCQCARTTYWDDLGKLLATWNRRVAPAAPTTLAA